MNVVSNTFTSTVWFIFAKHFMWHDQWLNSPWKYIKNDSKYLNLSINSSPRPYGSKLASCSVQNNNTFNECELIVNVLHWIETIQLVASQYKEMYLFKMILHSTYELYNF